VQRLSSLSDLELLGLAGNPVAQASQYRIQVFTLICSENVLLLDGQPPSRREVEELRRRARGPRGRCTTVAGTAKSRSLDSQDRPPVVEEKRDTFHQRTVSDDATAPALGDPLVDWNPIGAGATRSSASSLRVIGQVEESSGEVPYEGTAEPPARGLGSGSSGAESAMAYGFDASTKHLRRRTNPGWGSMLGDVDAPVPVPWPPPPLPVEASMTSGRGDTRIPVGALVHASLSDHARSKYGKVQNRPRMKLRREAQIDEDDEATSCKQADSSMMVRSAVLPADVVHQPWSEESFSTAGPEGFVKCSIHSEYPPQDRPVSDSNELCPPSMEGFEKSRNSMLDYREASGSVVTEALDNARDPTAPQATNPTSGNPFPGSTLSQLAGAAPGGGY
jgi:hypothetical protein